MIKFYISLRFVLISENIYKKIYPNTLCVFICILTFEEWEENINGALDIGSLVQYL